MGEKKAPKPDTDIINFNKFPFVDISRPNIFDLPKLNLLGNIMVHNYNGTNQRDGENEG